MSLRASALFVALLAFSCAPAPASGARAVGPEGKVFAEDPAMVVQPGGRYAGP